MFTSDWHNSNYSYFIVCEKMAPMNFNLSYANQDRGYPRSATYHVQTCPTSGVDSHLHFVAKSAIVNVRDRDNRMLKVIDETIWTLWE